MTSQTSSSPALTAAEEQFVAPRVPAAVAAGRSAGVVAVGVILVEKAVFLAEEKLVAWKLFVVPPHKAVEPAVDVGVVEVAHNLDIVGLAVGCLAEDPAFELPAFELLAFEAPAYVGAGRVDVAAYWGHCEDCR